MKHCRCAAANYGCGDWGAPECKGALHGRTRTRVIVRGRWSMQYGELTAGCVRIFHTSSGKLSTQCIRGKRYLAGVNGCPAALLPSAFIVRGLPC